MAPCARQQDGIDLLFFFDSDLSMADKIRFLLVDDHPVVRRGVHSLLESESGYAVVAEASGYDEALRAFDHTDVDLIILDISLKRGSGLDLIRQIRARDGEVPILVLSMHLEQYYAERALRAGAQGYISKQAGIKQIVPAVRALLSGDTFLGEDMVGEMTREAVETGRDGAQVLSDREAEVVRFIGEGYSTREVADELKLSIKTIESYRANVKRKFGLQNASQLTRFAYDWTQRALGTVHEQSEEVRRMPPPAPACDRRRNATKDGEKKVSSDD